MRSYTHTREVPSDADPDIVAAATAADTGPEFILRPGFLRCPRCKRAWPESDYRHDRAAYAPEQVRARCADCRRGLSYALRQAAIASGTCEARNCAEPIVRNYKCDRHAMLTARHYARRAATTTTKEPTE